MNLPSTVKVGPLTYTIEPNTERLEGEHAWGVVIDGEQRILIKDDATVDQQRVTLLHEVLHTINDGSLKYQELTHAQVNGLTLALLQVMGDNPEVLDFVFNQHLLDPLTLSECHKCGNSEGFWLKGYECEKCGFDHKQLLGKR